MIEIYNIEQMMLFWKKLGGHLQIFKDKIHW